MAVLYVNIIAAKEKQPDVYHKYRRNMEQFALAQMEAGHMDDNLAILYQEILPVSILNEELAHKAAEVLFVHKLCCENPVSYTHLDVYKRQAYSNVFRAEWFLRDGYHAFTGL